MDAPSDNEQENDEEVEEDDDNEEEEEEDTYVETQTQEVISEYEDKIADYTNDPETPEEQATNDSIKRFLVQKVRNRLLDSFEDQMKWLEDADLVSMLKKWKKVTSKDDELDPSTAMKRIIKENNVIVETVEQQLDDMMMETTEEEVE
jgi:hypothetical protein